MAYLRSLLLAVPLLALAALAAVLMTPGGSSGGLSAQASAVCANAQRELKELPQSPTSVAGALAMQHSMLAILKREVFELQALGPQASPAFRAGLVDDQALFRELSSMLARPDYVHLALTLPGHPNLVPAWLKRWLARTHALQADARTQFARADIPACEKALG